MNVRRSALLLVSLLALAACGHRERTVSGGAQPESDRATVSVERVEAHAAPSATSPAVKSFPRGTELKVLDAKEGFWRVQPRGGPEAWVEAGTFERERDREAREKRATGVAKFVAQPGRAVENAPVLLAPAYGAARWGDVEDGDDVAVVLHDHDFYGIRVPGARLAFVPARSVRLLPSAMAGATEPAPRRQIVPQVTSLGDPGIVSHAPAPPAPPREPVRDGPLESLPPGSEPPSLAVRVEPVYPDAARRAGVGGEVTLRVVVNADGTVGKVDVVSGAPMGLTEAAVDAVKRWRYQPARVGDRPAAVVKTIRVRFSPGR